MYTLFRYITLFYLGAEQTYFKSRKSHEKRKLCGRALACAAEGCKRQRSHNVSSFHQSSLNMMHLQKAHACARALKQSITLDKDAKK